MPFTLQAISERAEHRCVKRERISDFWRGTLNRGNDSMELLCCAVSNIYQNKVNFIVQNGWGRRIRTSMKKEIGSRSNTPVNFMNVSKRHCLTGLI